MQNEAKKYSIQTHVARWKHFYFAFPSLLLRW